MDTSPVTVDRVLQLLRQLPPRDRLRVVAQVLPDLESNLSATPSVLGFWEGADVHMLAERQGVQPVDDFDALLGGWPEGEPIEDFLAAVHQWRRQNPAEVGA